jgi:membrane-bound serine protease (ClpP class)
MKNIFIGIILCFIISALSLPQSNASKYPVYALTVDASINPATEGYILRGIETAKDNNAQCLIIKLNTPGGLLSSTRRIISGILLSPIPVIVYVSPQGAQAASAGVFITLAAHIAAMAPGTNIGAAHPVTLQGQSDTVMIGKVTNDAAAFIKSISKKRNRNVQWAEDAVRKSISITEAEALEKNVINLIAENTNELLNKVDGMVINTSEGNKTLRTKNTYIIQADMTFQEKLLNVLSDPNIAYVLMMIGFYGLLFELFNPGSIFPGIVGAISLILAFYSLNTLPVNYAGIGLIILAIVLFVLEIKIVSHGLLSIGGALSLFLGSIMLFKTGSFLERVIISRELIISIVAMTTLFFLFIIGAGLRAQKVKPSTGTAGLIGETGTSLSELTPKGQVFVHGEIWSAESIDGDICKGQNVVVDHIEDLNLKVKRIA